MTQDNRHRSFLTFIRKVSDAAAGYSKDDLIAFRSVATREFPALVHVLDEYIRFAERADTSVERPSARTTDSERGSGRRRAELHLFDLLRERTLFPQNSDLVEFAIRILPDMRSYRFDKMSKSDIAARVVEYLETLPSKRKSELERSMRSAVLDEPVRALDRRSFLDTWERIIKGV